MDYQTFNTWREVLEHVRSGAQLYYHAPFDLEPAMVGAKTVRGGKVRIVPRTSDADAFTADRKHLDRMRKGPLFHPEYGHYYGPALTELGKRPKHDRAIVQSGVPADVPFAIDTASRYGKEGVCVPRCIARQTQ